MSVCMRFEAVDEPRPGPRSRAWIDRERARVQAWYRSAAEDGHRLPRAAECRRRLADAMPELLAGYDAACELAGDDPDTHIALSEVDPPPRIPSGCTIRALRGATPALVRNYDFHPDATAGVILRSRWHDTTIVGMGEGVIGYLDAVNDRGLSGGEVATTGAVSVIRGNAAIPEAPSPLVDPVFAERGIEHGFGVRGSGAKLASPRRRDDRVHLLAHRNPADRRIHR